ncbi:uncharacterized protein MONOS_424 [Monocercomonoides exilis]|uniref:uncharacterized protein n=1 Tax=Monocercomonoides exilis TaxID=2049356 RepID=UPI00355A5207|nr:hypothetical protein MONOS_424 [Monocercomonoides exilis]|eukprot:MONOS_424.1-p1 / transcript=MONOS_424.1 / gene=MONOS_424 / organism=Monocercomonoides_exilis_PA203 / gene_product=unspecified product / transcript_product=unspecified product / location=Mono_scaffold00007:38993-40196(-) / protein_length=375 / sequence_SO=supercontig / SO=protein_coding / is_pseudo=false
MNSCSFLSVCDAYDGGIVHSLNNPYASLTVSNTSFVGCCRTRNVECNGTSDKKLTPGRQNETFNGANSFTLCEWSESKATGKGETYADGTSNGGAIFMYSQSNASVSVSHCVFNGCVAYSRGGGIMCTSIKEVKIENNTFDSCTAQSHYGGGMFINLISSCVWISGCEFQKCSSHGWGGVLHLENFQVSAVVQVAEECAATMFLLYSKCMQFISCSAVSVGGGLRFNPDQSTPTSNNHYFYFFFFHDCSCNASTPYGHDVYFYDGNNLFSSNNPFYESYTTNTNDTRVCRQYYNGSSWVPQHTEKKGWLKEGMKDRYVGVSGNDSSNLCGMSESAPCKTVGHAVGASLAQLSSTITLLRGRQVSEGAKISIGEK